MSHSILILNGPNLNLLGTREPEVYGRETLDDIKRLCAAEASKLSLSVDFRQSNAEAELIGWVQDSSRFQGIIINPAGLSHTSVALMDALLAVKIPIIEVHLSNIFRREEFRHHSYVSRAAKGVITGLGSQGYILALKALAEIKQ
jgi:3-dehydroquinate dehydratase-2